jgi:hypothetical protein
MERTSKNQLKFAMIAGLVVTSYVTFTVVAINAGFQNNFIRRWLTSWFAAYLLVVPSLFYVGPFIKKKFNL